MQSRALMRWILVVTCLAAILAPACRKSPEQRKQEFLNSGNDYFAKEQYREAAIQYLNAIKEDQQFVEAHYQLAQSYLKLKIFGGAYQELLRTVDLKPEHAKAQIDLGNLLLASRQFKEAQERAALALKVEPNNVEAHILLANAHALLRNPAASFEEMQTAIQLDPERAQSYLNLGVLQLGANQAADAEANFKKAVALAPRSVDAKIALGTFYAAQKRWAEAEQMFRQAAQVEPKNPATYSSLARLYVAQKRMDEVEGLLTDAKKQLADVPEGYRLLGDFYIATGNSAKALTEYASLHSEHPDDVQTQKIYAQLLLGAGRLEEAEAVVQKIQKKNPRDIDGRILRAQIMMNRRQFQDAVTLLETAVKTETNNPQLRFHLGRAFFASGNRVRAEAEWREALRLNPTFLAVQESLAGLMTDKGDWSQVETIAEAIIQANPNMPNGYLHRAAGRAGKGNRSGAEADLREAIRMAPQSALPRIRLGNVKAIGGKFGEAEKEFERALELDPSSTSALQGLVAVYQQQKLPAARAVARVNAQIAKAPNVSGHHAILGTAYELDRDPVNAEKAYTRAIELDVKNLQAILALGQLQDRTGALDKAAATYQRGIQTDPNQPLTYVLLGSLEEKRGNWQSAQQLYERALRVEVDFPLAANNLAYLMLERGGNVDTALSYAQVARRALPNLPNTADTLAWAYYHKGVYSSAIDLLKEAVQMVPENATYHYHLGMAYLKNHDPAKAKQHLSRSLELKPPTEKIEEIRETLKGL